MAPYRTRQKTYDGMWCDEGPTTNALANGTFNQMNRIIQLHNRRARRSTADTHNSWLLLTIINSCARGYLQILISPHDLPPRTRLLLLADWLYLVPWPILVDYGPSCLKADMSYVAKTHFLSLQLHTSCPMSIWGVIACNFSPLSLS